MANQTGSYTNISDLMAKLSTFATSNGWTQDHSASDRLFLTNGTVSVAFRWATSSPTWVAMYQHTAFLNSSTDPGNHTNDSGTGEISSVDTTLDNARGFNCNDTSGGSYWFFEDATYIHCVITYQDDWYEHFGFGIIDKAGTWTGGEYCYGQYDRGKTTTGGVQTISTSSTYLLDAIAQGHSTNNKYSATMRGESLPGQVANERWLVVGDGDYLTDPTYNDRAGNNRYFCQGGFRGGPDAQSFARFTSLNTTGMIPMYPLKCWWANRNDTSQWYYLGQMKDVRGINIKYHSGGDEITIGSDTWVVFPARWKQGTSANPTTGDTGNLGMAYKKVA